jgi:Fe-Mn family superoxide dismutase
MMIQLKPLLFSALIVAAAAGATYELPPLPFSTSALKPMIGKKTLQIHHGKHHAKYVNTMNLLVEGTILENQPLETIMKAAYKNNPVLFNNAAQAWNHSFYWKCLTPKGGGIPHDKLVLAKMIDSSFGSYAEFRRQFAEAANTAFGSGWAWLVCDRKGNLTVCTTIGAENPLVTSWWGVTIPILTCDVWEHAYYLDYANMRPSYVDTFLDKLVNWEFVAENLERAMDSGRAAEL